MPIAWIEDPEARIRLESERLVVKQPARDDESTTETDIPLADIERLVLHESVQITTPALVETMRRQIPVVFHSWNGRLLASTQPPEPAHTSTRMKQYAASNEPVFSLGITRQLVVAKIRNQRRLLQKLDSKRPRLEPAIGEDLLRAMSAVERAGSVDAVRGCEGAAAVLYWSAWQKFLPAAFPFEGRSTRPPGNPVNACLSYLSALLYGECQLACHRRGLDPGIGCLHVTQNGRWSLALDLMEPFRSVVIEALTLQLLGRGILQEQHFEKRDGGVYLNAEGRKALIRQYEKKLNRQFQNPMREEKSTLRREIDEQTLAYKRALEDPHRFRAFALTN